MTKHYAIIGAGAGGLAAAKYLGAKGIETTVFECGSQVGGLWVYDNDSGMSPAYRSLHINSEAHVSSFADFPFPPHAPLYPDHAEMSRYFQRYAEHFDLVRRIRFRNRVSRVEPVGGRYRVCTAQGTAEVFDGVVVATGHQSVPRHPPDLASFTGEYIHAHAYRVPEPYAGKRVLVIGPGNSGVDIAADICSVPTRQDRAHRGSGAGSPPAGRARPVDGVDRRSGRACPSSRGDRRADPGRAGRPIFPPGGSPRSTAPRPGWPG